MNDEIQTDESRDQENHKRPASLTIISILAIALFGFGYVSAFVMLSRGDESRGLSWSRLISEPDESEGGIPWPGWDNLSDGLRGRSSDLTDTIAAHYWWAKMKTLGGMIFGPLVILGWIGVFVGRRWGRTLLYLYLALWMSNKVLYLFVLREDGVTWFSIAVCLTILLCSLLNLKSWKGWIESYSPEVKLA